MDIAGVGIKLRHLQVLREVLRAGSERLAAQILHITQPAVSQNIKQLEAAVGFPLFIRENNRLLATDQAWELLRTIDAAFSGLDRLGKAIEGIRSNERRTIVIAAPGEFSLRLLPQVVMNLRSDYPRQPVQIRSGTYRDIADHVHQGRADIAISRLPLDARLFDSVPVAQAVNVCLFPAGHRFRAHTVITPGDLIGEAIVDIDPQLAAHTMNVNALRFMGSEPDIAVEFDHHGHDAGFVAAGVGVSITNEVIAREYQLYGLLSRPLEPTATYHYVVFWQKGRQLARPLQASVDYLVAAFASER